MPQELILLLNLLLSFVLGGLIGLERELAGKPAGLRTHMLLAGASTLFVSLSFNIVLDTPVPFEQVRSDPVRIIEAVVTAIAFLGAGTIIQRKRDVEGLTTAASLLFVGAIGVAVALGEYVVAIGAVAITLIILRGLGRITFTRAMRREQEARAEKERQLREHANGADAD